MIITRGHETTNFHFLLKKHNECFHFKEFGLRKICVLQKRGCFFVFVAEVIHFWFLSGSDIRDSIREQLVQKLQMQAG